MKTFKTTHEAYLQALKDIWFEPQFRVAPRGLPIRETLNYSFTVTEPVAEALVTHDKERNEIIKSYTEKECELYDSCSNRVEDFAKASKFWNKLANPDGTVNSAYGYLIWGNKSHGDKMFEWLTNGQNDETLANGEDNGMRTPWEWAKQSLIKDKDTRQAILRFSLPEHAYMGVKDFTCTMHGNFLIRDDKLYLTIVMRSNDLLKGLVFDLPWFVSLMDKMVEELKPTYPELTKGEYSHTVHSMHAYEKDEKAILKMLGRSTYS